MASSINLCNSPKTVVSNEGFSLGRYDENDEINAFLHKVAECPYRNPDAIKFYLFRDSNGDFNGASLISNGLDLSRLEDFIFENSPRDQMLVLLEIFSEIDFFFQQNQLYFKRSSHNKVRLAIVKDVDHKLTNDTFMDMVVKYRLNEKEIENCYDLAYFCNHPYIYRIAKAPVQKSDYTLNFLWVNRDVQDSVKDVAENIFKDGTDVVENWPYIRNRAEWTELKKRVIHMNQESDCILLRRIKNSFMYNIAKCAKLYSGVTINLWYDRALVTERAQKKTFEMLQDISESTKANLQLRDVRQLRNIPKEIVNSLHSSTPVYFRVDMLKALIADHMVNSPEEHAKYCVVSDIDVERMAPERMFDQYTLDYLSEYGYVFGRFRNLSIENSFFILNREHKNASTIHNQVMIQDIASAITAVREVQKDSPLKGDQVFSSTYVFDYGLLKFSQKMELELEENAKVRAIRQRGDRLPVAKLFPGKVVKCPESQFCSGIDRFSLKDHRREIFRFIGNETVPHVINGRNLPGIVRKKIVL